MRRFLAVSSLAVAAFAVAPAPAVASCVEQVPGLCVASPCDVPNFAYRTVTGEDLLLC